MPTLIRSAIYIEDLMVMLDHINLFLYAPLDTMMATILQMLMNITVRKMFE